MEFPFDDEIINSRAYRRALAALRSQASPRHNLQEPVQGDLIDLATPDPPLLQPDGEISEHLKSLQLIASGSATMEAVDAQEEFTSLDDDTQFSFKLGDEKAYESMSLLAGKTAPELEKLSLISMYSLLFRKAQPSSSLTGK